ncbi:thioredoxin-like protein [Schizophyllum commune H4-8]|uniref:glutathione transferase n=1 Tax=Schizophyllum commune (strain H4-8 / FGSC 9210) TaxID=578458 RepID=D8QIR7_SCHCM|nr:thioredoxin-like protein [Schizophyllum commune H4-8]KAI5886115.1 thioredoxin-like protein [Schizophyllum commune H4-8]
MVLTLYGSPMSTCTRRVGIVLMEKKIPFKFVPIDLAKAEHKKPEFVEKQPFGQVPYIVDDDGFTLFESRAIARYLNDKYPEQGINLVPTGLKEKALFEQAVSIEGSNFDRYASSAVAEKIFKPMKGLGGSDELAKTELEVLDKKLDAYDVILGRQKYLAGDKLTLADLFHIPYGSMLAKIGYNGLEKKPNVARWWKDISSRESWQAVKDGVKGTA